MKCNRRGFLKTSSVICTTPFVGFGNNKEIVEPHFLKKEKGICSHSLIEDTLIEDNLNTYRYEVDRYQSHVFCLDENHKVKVFSNLEENVVNVPTSKKITSTQEEDKKFIELLNVASTFVPKTNIVEGNLSINNINNAFATIECNDILVEGIIVNPLIFERMKKNPYYVEVDSSDGVQEGFLWTAKIFTHSDVPVDKIFFLPSKEYFGVIMNPDGSNSYGMSILCGRNMSILHLKDFGQRHRLRFC